MHPQLRGSQYPLISGYLIMKIKIFKNRVELELEFYLSINIIKIIFKFLKLIFFSFFEILIIKDQFKFIFDISKKKFQKNEKKSDDQTDSKTLLNGLVAFVCCNFSFILLHFLTFSFPSFK